MSIVLAFGVNTPVYPFLRDHLPILASFRFPVKYLAAFSMAVAAGAAAGWDALSAAGAARDVPAIYRRARAYAVAFALLVAALAGGLAAASTYAPEATAVRASSFARALGVRETADAGKFMSTALPRLGRLLCRWPWERRSCSRSPAGRATGLRWRVPHFSSPSPAIWLCAHPVLNPVFDARYLAEPEWLQRTKSDADSRFYVGGKREGTLDPWDQDSSRGFLNPAGLTGSASRAALSGQTAFYPSAWQGREMLSYDAAVLWPGLFNLTSERFFESDRTARDLFLDRTGVRYRVLPDRLAAGNAPLVKVPYYLGVLPLRLGTARCSAGERRRIRDGRCGSDASDRGALHGRLEQP